MISMSRTAALLLATLFVVAGCPEKKTTASSSSPELLLQPNVTAISADGASEAVIMISGGTGSTIDVMTSKGTLNGVGPSVKLTGTSGTVTLRACDSGTSSNCVGAAEITARDSAGVAGSTIVTFTASEICDNQVDDDTNGATDCKDSACPLNVSCDALGHVCAADRTCTKCGGGGGVAQTKETTCNDGSDNDCDGDADCAESDCDGKSCVDGAIVGTCSSGACACDQTETTEASCSDGGDNDCDGKIDCADPDCDGRLCDTVKGLACGGTPAGCTVCQSSQTNETATQCADGRDNDCDGKTDCDDPDCAGMKCDAFGSLCTSGVGARCTCPTGTAETNCADNIDNDCNGKVDCADTNCRQQQCGKTAAFTCDAGSCVDAGTRYSVAVTAARERLPALIDATSRVTLTVLFEGKPAQGKLVDLELDDTTLGHFDVTPASVYTDGAGQASFNFVASGDVGLVKLTATLHDAGTTGFTVIEMPALGEIRVASVQYPVMGVMHSGYQEQNNLAVELLDMEAQPYPAGLPVRFEHLTLGGSALSSPATDDSLDGSCSFPWCVGFSTETDDGGIAKVTLYSGTVAGTIPVTASAQAGTLPKRTFDLPTVSVIGARASGAHLAVVCDPLNVPALAATTCYTSLMDAPFHCVAVLKDRFNNIVGRATQVTFMSEAGAVGQPATTPAYDATKDPVSQADLGLAREVIATLGNKLPKDVPPHAGTANPYGLTLVSGDPEWEHSLNYDDRRCLLTTHNPRDGAVSVVASTPGEEAFFDANGNGVYDGEPCTADANLNGISCDGGEYVDTNKNGKWDSEPFIDLPEPYVDYDDNNTRDLDEPFIDSNSNGKWDPPNGKWDSTAKIWTQTRVVFTSAPRGSAYSGDQEFSRWMTVADVATFPAATPKPTAATDFLVQGPSAILDVSVAVTDDNFNPVAPETPLAVWSFGETIDSYDGYYGVKAMRDLLGFTFVYWPCDASDTAKCANDCAYANSPPPARCVMRSVLRGYQYGYMANVRFFNPETPSAHTTTFLLGAGDLRIPQAVNYAP